MENLLFLNQKEPIKAEVKQLGKNKICIITNVLPNTTGFHLVTTEGFIYGKYEDYTTLYKEIENGFILSNDGSIYVEPEPIEPLPVLEPTLGEIQESKVSEMNEAQQQVIQKGVDVVLSDGSTEHFTLKDQDQTSLVGLQTQVIAGEENIPWHTSDEAEHCKFYSNADMALITTAAMACVTWHVTYFRDLRIYIRSLQTKEEVEAIIYGVDIPEEYRSEPLKAMIAARES